MDPSFCQSHKQLQKWQVRRRGYRLYKKEGVQHFLARWQRRALGWAWPRSQSIGSSGLALEWNGRVTISWLADEPVVGRIPRIWVAQIGGSYHNGYPDSFGGPPVLRRRGALQVVVFLPGNQRQANNVINNLNLSLTLQKNLQRQFVMTSLQCWKKNI